LPKPTLGAGLGSIDQHADFGQVAASQASPAWGHQHVALREELLEPGAQHGSAASNARNRSGAAGELAAAAASVESVRAVASRQRRRISSTAPPPRCRRSGPHRVLFRDDATRRDHQAMPRRKTELPLEAHRSKLHLQQLSRITAEDAVWSSLPPRVPTPASPLKGPNGLPFSAAPR
jgi:hypothetical protein